MICLTWCLKERLLLKMTEVSGVWGGRQSESVIIDGETEVVSGFGDRFGADDDHI